MENPPTMRELFAILGDVAQDPSLAIADSHHVA
jgi:hypothetical protein